jgi:3-oxoadipate enol-lactonase
MSYQSGFVEINGADLFYEVKGEGHTVLLLHGYPLDSRMWDDQFEELSQNYQVIRFDYAGCGKSGPHNHEYSIVADVKGLLSFLQVKKMDLIGLSVGGNVAMDFTLAYPEMVEKLVLVSTGILGWSEFSEERKSYNQGLNELFQNGLNDKAVEFMCKAWLAGPFRSMAEINPALVQKYKTMLTDNLLRENAKMTLPKVRTIDLVNRISAPTLILSPDIDFPEFKTIAQFIHEKITVSKLAVISGTAHMIPMEKPLEFNRLVVEFLQRSEIRS